MTFHMDDVDSFDLIDDIMKQNLTILMYHLHG
jgi:hypothetical protein